jgi:SET domain-containing protein
MASAYSPSATNIIYLDTYINHSPHANLRTKDGVRFITTRRVQEGEELTVDYNTYGAHLY